MSYKGSMEGWHEKECHGHCGLCDDCERVYHERCDSEYEAFRDEEVMVC